MADDERYHPALPEPALVREISAPREEVDIEEVSASVEPVILRGFVSDWPVVAAAKNSESELLSYLTAFDRGATVPVSVGPASLDGRVFYNQDVSGLNIERGNAKVGDVLQRVHDHARQTPPPLIYLASADVDDCLPGFRQQNDIDLGEQHPIVSIWIGTHTRVAAHNDLPRNIACVAAGRRRFTLFPPEQISNLYVGPFEFTPAGRPISLVDFAKPDLDQFPRFSDAMKVAQVAELEPGDALFIPSMWWHHVEALGTFNVLVNYWWRTVPSYLGTPQDVLNHAMMTLRDLPAEEKAIWRMMFEHYVFNNDDSVTDHVPDAVQGILSPMTEERARQVRAFLLNRLNR